MILARKTVFLSGNFSVFFVIVIVLTIMLYCTFRRVVLIMPHHLWVYQSALSFRSYLTLYLRMHGRYWRRMNWREHVQGHLSLRCSFMPYIHISVLITEAYLVDCYFRGIPQSLLEPSSMINFFLIAFVIHLCNLIP